jgi:hypothetical protein
MSLKVKYTNVSDGAYDNMSLSSEDGQLFSNASGLPGDGFADTPWATLEPNSWVLDGSRKLIKDDADIGWWSLERSGEDGVFYTHPKIRIDFGEMVQMSAPGITFRFWPSLGEWCNEIQVTWYYGYEIVSTKIAYPDSANWYLDMPVDDFNAIEIDFVSTNVPGHFAKLQSLNIGQVHLFFQDEIVRVSLLNEVDPSACELSADELTVEIREKKSRYLNVQENDRIEFYQNDKLIASHYVQNFSREGETKYTFKCNSAIILLDGTFYGGLYDGEGLSIVLTELFENIPWSLDEAFAVETISGYLPVCTRREALQQIAFAIGARVTTQGDGVIHISKIAVDDFSPTSAFGKGSIFTGQTLKKEKTPSEIKVVTYQYQEGGDAEEEILLENVIVNRGDVIVFDEPHWGYSYEAVSEGIEINTYPNYIEIVGDVSSVGIVWLKGKKYTKVAKENTWKFGASSGNSNAVKVDKATLVTDKNLDSVMSRLRHYYSLPNLLNGNVVVDGQKAGDVVEIANPYGNDLTAGYITSMDSEFTVNGHTAKIEIRGADVRGANAEVLKR